MVRLRRSLVPVSRNPNYHGTSGMDIKEMVSRGNRSSEGNWCIITPPSSRPYIRMIDISHNIGILIFQKKIDKDFLIKFRAISPSFQRTNNGRLQSAINLYIQFLKTQARFTNVLEVENSSIQTGNSPHRNRSWI